MFRVVFWLLLVSSALCAQTGGIVSGVIRNAWSRAPLSRAVVTLSTTGAEPLDAVTYSDSNGAFAFGDVPGGTYELCARAKSYERVCYGRESDPGRPTIPLTVRAGQSRRDIILPALPLGSVSGTVTDSDGDPVAGAQIEMLHANYSRRSLHWVAVGHAMSNDRGEYRMGFVRPGQYRFMAVRRFQPAVISHPDVTYGVAPPEEIYNTQYYPNAEDVAAAASVTLNAGNDIKGIDFTLTPAPGAQVQGTVDVPPEAGRNAVVTLEILPIGPAPMSQAISAGASGPEYRFQFPMIPPGPHRLLALLKSEDRTYFSSQVVNAQSGAGDISVPLTPGSPLKGHLQLLGKDAKSHGPYTVRLSAGDDMRFLNESPTADVRDDGFFEFDDVVPGLWDIGVEPQPPGSYIKSMTLGQQDVLTEDMFLTGGSREPLNLVLDMDGAIIGGNVVESGTDHPERAMVLLAPDGKFDNVLSFYSVASTDEQGRFEFKSVTPGHYKIYAFDRMEPGEFANPEFLKPYLGRSESFDVSAGARLTRKATLIVRGESGSQ